MRQAECVRCSVCGKEVPARVLCHLTTDFGQVYESCACVCDECRRALKERRDLTLWEPKS